MSKRGFATKNGHGVLTNKRFIYCKHSLAKTLTIGIWVNLTKGQYEYDIAVDDISTVNVGKHMLGHALTIVTKDGEIHKFGIVKPLNWEMVFNIDNKKHLFDGKLIPYFKDIPINQIKAAQIRKWQNELINSEEGYAPTYLKSINNQLSAIMNYAVKYYGLPSSPCHIAGSMGKKDADEMQIWTMDEFNQFIAKVDKPAIRLAFMVMFWTHLRVGECIALTSDDIVNNKIDVNKSTSRRDGEDKIYDPKTTMSARQVPIPDFLSDEIHSYIDSTYMMKGTDKIFYFTKSTLNKALDQFVTIAGIERIRVHGLRHP